MCKKLKYTKKNIYKGFKNRINLIKYNIMVIKYWLSIQITINIIGCRG
jgi:hypothetical protein